MQAERRAFAEAVAAVSPERLVYVDESGITPGQRVGYGYALRGHRCREAAPLRAPGRLNLIGAVAVGRGAIQAYPVVVTSGVFEHFVETALAGVLRAGDVLVWDNARIHSRQAERMAEHFGARVLRQPRYSPDANGIEMAWSKVKAHVRAARADTAVALAAAVASGVASVTDADLEGWVRHVTRPQHLCP